MDRQNMIIAAIAVGALVLVGVFAFWPENANEAVTESTTAPVAESGGY